MARYDEELLKAARRLVARRKRRPGRLSGARIRRSISTTYYALFHFLVEEAGLILIGTHNDLRRRRRTFAREFNHKGMKVALEKVGGNKVNTSVADLLRPQGVADGDVLSPMFARTMARAFSDAQVKRHDADYNLNAEMGEADARLLISQVQRAMQAWGTADSGSDRDFKRALCLLMLLRGQLRQEN